MAVIVLKNIDNYIEAIKNEAIYYQKKYHDVKADFKAYRFDKYTNIEKTILRYEKLSDIYQNKLLNVQKLKVRFWPNRRFVYFSVPNYLLKQQANGNFLTMIKGLHFQIEKEHCKMLPTNNRFLIELDIFQEYTTQEHEVALLGGEIHDILIPILSIEKVIKQH